MFLHFLRQLLSYSGGNKFIVDNSALMGVDFAVSDPSQGDASLSIAALTAAHTGTYQCKVKKAPGLDTRKITLAILGNVAPFSDTTKIQPRIKCTEFIPKI